MMKRLLRPLRQAYLLSITLLTIVIGLALELTSHHQAAHWLLGIVAAAGSLPLIKHIWQEVRVGKYGVNILTPATVIIAITLGQYWPAILIILLNIIASRLAGFASRRARRDLNELLDHVPKKASVIRKGKAGAVSVSELKTGDKIIIKAGETVPADAVILDGQAEFDESALAAGALPIVKQKGDQLHSGLVALNGSVTARVTAPAGDSQFQQIARLIKSTANAHAPLARLGEFYCLPFTILCLGIAAAAWVISGQSIRFLDVLVVFSFTPLLVAVPIALAGGLARAGREGIIIKGDAVFEKLAKSRLIAFNKTGTLTEGRPDVDSIKTFGDHSEDDILRLAASLEQGSDHVIAEAIVSAAQTKQLKLIKAKHVAVLPSLGLKATLQGQSVLAGRLELLQEADVEMPPKFQPESINQTAVYVAQGDKLTGVILLKDELRPEAATALGQLKRQKLALAMVTGDSQTASQSLAKQLDISEVHADALPANKVHLVENFRLRPAVYVSNDLRDAAALNTASVGIVLGAQGLTGASGGTADVIIIPNDLACISLAIALAKRSFKIARQSMLVGLGLGIAFALVFATGKLPPLLGVFLQFTLSIFSIFYALRACR